jgi:hypothetical protein
MRTIPILAAAWWIAVVPASGQNPASPPQGTPPAASNSSTATSTETRLRENIQELTDRVLKLEIESAKPREPAKGNELVIAVIAGFAGLIAALVGGGMTLLAQRMTAQREREKEILAAKQELELAQETAQQQLKIKRYETVFQNTQKILEFRMKQLELFYAPMFSHLEQSKELYKKLHRQLVRDDPKRYKLLNEADKDGYWLHVLDDKGVEHGFRLLDQLPAVRSHPNAYALVKAILEIGKQMTEIISTHSGLASADLVRLLGEYTAHYAILSNIDASGSTTPYPPGWHTMGYYPRELNKKVEAGYLELSQLLDDYSNASKELLATLPIQGSLAVANSGQRANNNPEAVGTGGSTGAVTK